MAVGFRQQLYVERTVDFHRGWPGQPGPLGPSGLIAERFGQTFPWGTLFVNVTGSLRHRPLRHADRTRRTLAAPSAFRQFFMIGFCGGYTTFSSFSLQTLNLAEDGQWFKAGANASCRWSLCLVGVWLGTWSPWHQHSKGS